MRTHRITIRLLAGCHADHVQGFATSKDGTRIPYFVIGREDLALDGSNLVLLDAHDGFEVSMFPGYSAGSAPGGSSGSGSR
jgi:prolyl oligopeptidase PreP (S9A serine peptidase family)